MKPVYSILSAVFLFLAIKTAKAQSVENQIKTKDQNQKWLWELEMLPLNEQIDKIQKRILIDTNLYESGTFVIRDQSPVLIRPAYIINDIPLKICKGVSLETLIQLNDIIKNTTTIKIMDEQQGLPIFGSIARGGILLLQLNDKKSEEKIKKMGLMEGNCK